jgi:hypothetical protein
MNKLESCPICNYPLPSHSSMCPDNFINSDVYQYWHCQNDDYDDYLTEDMVMPDIGDK